MSFALIHIGNAKTNTWRDGDVVEVRGEDTFSPLEHRYPMAVIPVGASTSGQMREWEKDGYEFDQNGDITPETKHRRRIYRIDWKSLIAAGDGTSPSLSTATEKDVTDGKTITWAEKDATVVEVRVEGPVIG